MIKILLISDIHISSSGTSENQGQVIKAFKEDIDKTLDANNYINNFCIIAGDLTQDGAPNSYDVLHKTIVSTLMKFMPLDNIYVTPGNHDLNRNKAGQNKTEIENILDGNTSENKFNDLLEGMKKGPIVSKFKGFTEYVSKHLNIDSFNLWGYSVNPTPTVSICLLNSAICSWGGYSDIDDSGNLCVSTRILNNWIQSNVGRKKILILHHPLSDLTYEFNVEVTKLVESDIDVLINGHTHFEKVHRIQVGNRSYLHFQTPQLFSSKEDENAYAIINIEEESGQIEDIIFRQWVDRRKCFSNGILFADEGIFKNDQFLLKPQDSLETELKNRLSESMKSYSMIPEWRERYLDENSPTKQTTTSGTWDYIKILSDTGNFQICGAPQFGLTCYAQYLSLKAWQTRNEHWVYIDLKDIRPAQVDNLLDRSLQIHGNINPDDVNGLIFDNWPYESEHSNRMLQKIRKKFRTGRIIICVKSQEANLIQGLDSELGDSFKVLYLRAISRKDMRTLACQVNSEKNFAEDNNILLERLEADIRDLNIHRTPYNCIQMLMALAKNYEEKPINRTKVLDNVLGLIFDNPGTLSYQTNLPDAETCKYIVGYFCEWLYRREESSEYFNEYFTEEDFNSICKDFCDQEFHGTNPRNILRTFMNNQIVVSDNAGRLKFRFTYWLSYFSSDRMKRDNDFRQFMINSHRILFNPEAIDFYTATDRERTDMVDLLAVEIKKLTESVHKAIGFPEYDDPYANLKWAMNETKEGVTVEQLEQQVCNSKLPDDIKDAIADRDYNAVKPYIQTINKFLEQFFVRNLILLMHTSAIALRNSEFANSASKRSLSEAIFASWCELANVLYSVTPLLAKNGFSGIGGQRFTLENGFHKEIFHECVKEIMICIPINITRWFSGDIFSSKNAPLYYEYLDAKYPPLVRHFAALLIAHKRPDGFKDKLLKYIELLPKNSFYLGNLSNTLVTEYQISFMNKSDQSKTIQLISQCYKASKKIMPSIERDDRNII